MRTLLSEELQSVSGGSECKTVDDESGGHSDCSLSDPNDCRSAILASSGFGAAVGAALGGLVGSVFAGVGAPVGAAVSVVLLGTSAGGVAASGNPSCQPGR